MKCLKNWPPFLYLCIVSDICSMHLLSPSINCTNNEWKCCNSDIAPQTQSTNWWHIVLKFFTCTFTVHACSLFQRTHKIKYSISDCLSERHALMPFSLIGYFQQNMIKCEPVTNFFWLVNCLIYSVVILYSSVIFICQLFCHFSYS